MKPLIVTPDLLDAMIDRRNQTWIRLGAGAGVGLTFVPLHGWAKTAAWFGVLAVVQVLEHLWTRRAEMRFRTGDALGALPGLALVLATNLVFSLIGLSAILSGQIWLMICGCFLLAGALLSASVASGASTLVFGAGTVSAAASCVMVLAVANRSGASDSEQIALGLAIGLFLCAAVIMRNVNVKALLALKAASESKGAFLANLSHEIRTPLNGILGVAQAMGRDDLSPAQRERLEIVSRSGFALLDLLNDVLDLSKVEAGRLELELRDADIGQLARDLGQTFGAGAAAKGVEVVVEVAPETEGLWRADTTRLRQVLTNLLSNAVKFTERGQVRLKVSRQGHAVSFAVSDSGIGIANDRLDHVFDKYTQASASTAREYGGTGLGLAICRDLAALMGGDLIVESVLGVGSTFRLDLPLARPVATPSAGVERAAPGDELIGIRILVAEDHEVNQAVLKLLLGQIGIDPYFVSDGQAAVDAYRDAAWDLVLMDVQMPGLDGPGAARAIRTFEAASGRAATPIIALTGNAQPHQVEAYIASGMDDHVAKPIEVTRLVEVMAKLLSADASVLVEGARCSA